LGILSEEFEAMRHLPTPLAAVAFLVFAACGGDSTGPSAAALTGQWAYNATNVSGSGLTCNFSGLTLVITQTGPTVTGATNGGSFSCTAAGTTQGGPLGTTPLANGQINGNAVQFDFGTADIHNAGTLNGKTISGTVTVRADAGGTIIVLSGNFSAVKQ
jgi:hypothetical protein